nr:immunoglobulin heavy chain junction region [Mus musculus]
CAREVPVITAVVEGYFDVW